MTNPIITYLDRNVYDTLNRMQNGSDYVALLQKFVNQGRIVIPLSSFVLEETLPVLRAKDRTKIPKEQKILTRLINWNYIIKSPDQLLAEALESWANKAPRLPEYYFFTAKSKDFFQTTPEEEAEILKVLDTSRAIHEKNKVEMKALQDDAVSKIPKGTKLYFQDLWEVLYIPFLDSLIQPLQPSMMEREDKDDLLGFKSVEVFVAYSIAYALKNLIEGREVKRSDLSDHYHIVSASVADVFVTHDDPLFEKLSLFGINGLDVMNFNRFLRWVKGGCR